MPISREAIRRPVQQPVAWLLLTLLSLALLVLPFLNFAPNRLVAGEPLMLWQIRYSGLLLVPLATLWLLLWRRPGRSTLILALLTAELMLALTLWLGGHQATLLSQQGSRLARTSFASGLWCSAAVILLQQRKIAQLPAE